MKTIATVVFCMLFILACKENVDDHPAVPSSSLDSCQRFKYLNRVHVINGFYEGYNAKVLSILKDPEYSCQTQYYVQLDSLRMDIRIYGKDIRLMEVDK